MKPSLRCIQNVAGCTAIAKLQHLFAHRIVNGPLTRLIHNRRRFTVSKIRSPHISRFYAQSATSKLSSISCETALKTADQYDVILDVRQPEEVSEGCIESNKFKHIPLPRIKEFKDSKEQEIQSLKGKKVLVYCRGGVRSMAATEILQKFGVNATNMEGGFTKWSELTKRQQK